MDITQFKRDSDRARKAFVTPKDSDMIVAGSNLKIYFPKHYLDGTLGSIDSTINVIAIFAIVVDDTHYGVSNAIAQMPLKPDNINTVKIGDSKYYELSWEKGSVVCPNRNLVKNNALAYEVYNEFITNGRTPWYMSYEDLGRLFDTGKSHAGSNLNVDHAILELFTASRARSKSDREVYYRETIKRQEEVSTGNPVILPLKSISHGLSNTTARLMGNYLHEGVNSALVNPSTQNESIEDALRQ